MPSQTLRLPGSTALPGAVPWIPWTSPSKNLGKYWVYGGYIYIYNIYITTIMVYGVYKPIYGFMVFDIMYIYYIRRIAIVNACFLFIGIVYAIYLWCFGGYH